MSETTSTPAPRARIWPVLIIVAIEVAVYIGFRRFGSTNLQSVAGNAATPLIGSIALVLWWLIGSRTPWKDRFLGALLAAACVGLIVVSQVSEWAPKDKMAQGLYFGGIHLALALLYLNIGIALVLLVTSGRNWATQRALLAAFVVLCAGYFVAQKVHGVGGDFLADTDWRWNARGGAAAGGAETHAAVKGTATVPASITPTDWPGFRGPTRDGVVAGVTFSTDWATPPKELWRHPIGAGHSSLCVVGDYLFTQEQLGRDETLTCFSTKTGEAVWTNTVPVQHDDPMGGEGPRATPAYGNGKVYAQSAGGLFQCLDASNGNVLWKADMLTKEATQPPQYGFASSPLVLGDVVVQYASGAGRSDMVAFDAATGAERWSTAKKTGGYGSPHFATLDGVPQILLLNSEGIQSYDPKDGGKIWEHVWPKKQFPRCVQPVLTAGGGIAMGATTDFGTRLVQVTYTDKTWIVKEAWTNEKHRPYFNDDVEHKGFMYGFDGNRLCCLDLKTGEQKWQGDRYGGQLIVLPAMEMLLVLSEKGKVALVKADPTAFTEVASFQAIKGKTWNHPVIANGKLFVRNSDEIACFELPGITTKTAQR